MIVDEVFRELAFESAPRPACSFGDRMISVCGLSKSHGLGGLRIGWIISHERFVRAARSVQNYTTIAPSSLAEEIAAWALENDDIFVRWRERILRKNRMKLGKTLDETAQLQVTLPECSNLCFPRLVPETDELRLAEHLASNHGVLVAPGRFFGCRNHLRLGFGVEPGMFAEGLAVLRAALSEET